MKLSREQVLHLARLARLRLTDEEVEAYRHDLTSILDYVDKLQELDTSEVSPTTHAVELSLEARGDVVAQRLTQTDVLRNAPAQVAGALQVPRVISE